MASVLNTITKFFTLTVLSSMLIGIGIGGLFSISATQYAMWFLVGGIVLFLYELKQLK